MPFFGDDKQGFSVESDDGTLLIQARGFWSAELSAQFLPAVLKELADSPMSSSALLDVAGLRPLPEEGQEAFRAVLDEILAHGLLTTVHIRGASDLTKLMLMRITRQIGKESVIVVE